MSNIQGEKTYKSWWGKTFKRTGRTGEFGIIQLWIEKSNEKFLQRSSDSVHNTLAAYLPNTFLQKLNHRISALSIKSFPLLCSVFQKLFPVHSLKILWHARLTTTNHIPYASLLHISVHSHFLSVLSSLLYEILLPFLPNIPDLSNSNEVGMISLWVCSLFTNIFEEQTSNRNAACLQMLWNDPPILTSLEMKTNVLEDLNGTLYWHFR